MRRIVPFKKIRGRKKQKIQRYAASDSGRPTYTLPYFSAYSNGQKRRYGYGDADFRHPTSPNMQIF